MLHCAEFTHCIFTCFQHLGKIKMSPSWKIYACPGCLTHR